MIKSRWDFSGGAAAKFSRPARMGKNRRAIPLENNNGRQLTVPSWCE